MPCLPDFWWVSFSYIVRACMFLSCSFPSFFFLHLPLVLHTCFLSELILMASLSAVWPHSQFVLRLDSALNLHRKEEARTHKLKEEEVVSSLGANCTPTKCVANLQSASIKRREPVHLSVRDPARDLSSAPPPRGLPHALLACFAVHTKGRVCRGGTAVSTCRHAA